MVVGITPNKSLGYGYFGLIYLLLCRSTGEFPINFGLAEIIVGSDYFPCIQPGMIYSRMFQPETANNSGNNFSL